MITRRSSLTAAATLGVVALGLAVPAPSATASPTCTPGDAAGLRDRLPSLGQGEGQAGHVPPWGVAMTSNGIHHWFRAELT